MKKLIALVALVFLAGCAGRHYVSSAEFFEHGYKEKYPVVYRMAHKLVKSSCPKKIVEDLELPKKFHYQGKEVSRVSISLQEEKECHYYRVEFDSRWGL